MARVGSKAEVRAAVAGIRATGSTVGFVPTMGALHDGHLSLVRDAKQRCDTVIVSIFVNPTQFAPGEDFERYPRRIEEDSALLQTAGADLVWTPSTDQMYAPDAQVTVEPGALAARWEGEVRPGHFVGVATVVAKLLNVVQADVACFGEKDFQQLAIVRRLALDLDMGCEIIGCPIIRDSNGLALSSRNAYLSAEERAAGLSLPAALEAAHAAVGLGERDGRRLEAIMREAVAAHAGDAMALDYAAVVDPSTLEPLERVGEVGRAIIAGRVGATRLLDNRALTSA
ncbi:MAG: pantoate--beta-alanine ligase [Coriobacteriia bacterium]|nr:pantoate--beta-alanine ligase [Coriobacteriia bacterium]